MAFHTKIGWILSGLVDRQEVSVNLTFTATHTLKIDNIKGSEKKKIIYIYIINRNP